MVILALVVLPFVNQFTRALVGSRTQLRQPLEVKENE